MSAVEARNRVARALSRALLGALPVLAGMLTYAALGALLFALFDGTLLVERVAPDSAIKYERIMVGSLVAQFFISWGVSVLLARWLSVSLRLTAVTTLAALLPMAYVEYGILAYFADCSAIVLPFAEEGRCN